MNEPIECTDDDKRIAREMFDYACYALHRNGITPSDDCDDFVLELVKFLKAGVSNVEFRGGAAFAPSAGT